MARPKIGEALTAVPAVVSTVLAPTVAVKAFELGQTMVSNPNVLDQIGNLPVFVDTQTLQLTVQYGIPATALALGAGVVYSYVRSRRISQN